MKRQHLAALLLSAWSLCAQAGEPFLPLARDDAAALVAPASHAGPTIIALWSADCVHCKKNLEHFAALAKAHPALRVVTVAVEPAEAAATEPLDRLQVPGPRFAYGDEAPEALSYALDPAWRGELPRTLFLDGQGGKTALSGVVTEERARSLLGLAGR